MSPAQRLALALPLVLFGFTAAVISLPESATAQVDFDQIDAACGTSNPYVITTCYAQGDRPDEPALVAFQDTDDNSGHLILASQADIGSAYGAAYNPAERALYVGAYHKRGTAFGPGGPGAIYRVDLTTGTTAQWLNVPDAGTDRHDTSDDYWPDSPAQDLAGLISLGDVELGPNGVLYVMNLLNRQIYRYQLSDKAFLGAIDIGSVNETWANRARPFGLAVHNDKLYHGVVNSAYRSTNLDDLQAYVYETDLDGSNVRLVTQFSLIYERGQACCGGTARWNPWVDGYASVIQGELGIYPQPMLADIEFSDENHMILGFRDRYGDMTFFNPGGRNPPNEGTGIPAGDIVFARYNGDTWEAQTEPEYFDEDYGPNPGVHQETGFGGMARLLTRNVVVNTGNSPLRISSGGAYWFDMGTGDTVAREELYNFESEVNFGKANGLGDVELLCGPEEATETPKATATATATATGTMTPTQTTTTTASETPTLTSTVPVPPTGTETRPPTGTPTTPADTATPTNTAPPGDEDEEDEEEPTPPPAATPELPKLPKTGFGAVDDHSWFFWPITVLALIAAGLVAEVRRRRLGLRRSE